MKISKSWLMVAVVTSALAFIGTRVLADDAIDIEYYTPNTAATFDGNGDFLYGGNDQDAVIDTLLSWPTSFSYNPGKTYTDWSFLAADASGSLDFYHNGSNTASTVNGLAWTPTVGQNISVSLTYSPFHSLPEISTPTAVTVYNSGVEGWASPGTPSGQVGGSSQMTTIPAALANTGTGTYGPLSQNLVSYLIEIPNVTITANGTFPKTWPASNAETAALGTLYLNDTAGNQLTLYFYYSQYACDGAMVGAPIPDSGNANGPAGPVNAWGFLSSFPSVSAGITNWQDEFIPTAFVGIPEPSSFMLAGIGLLSLLAVIRRRHS